MKELKNALPPVMSMWQKIAFCHNHPNVLALQRIHRYQKASGIAHDMVPFLRFSKKVTHGFEKNLHFQTAAIFPLRDACEAYLLETFELWKLCAIHAKRATIHFSDVHLIRCLQGRMIWRWRSVLLWQRHALKQIMWEQPDPRDSFPKFCGTTCDRSSKTNWTISIEISKWHVLLAMQLNVHLYGLT